MREKLVFILIILLIIISNNAFAKECSDFIKPQISFNVNEELFEAKEYYKKISDDKLIYFEYLMINSSLNEWFIDKRNQEINYTPSEEDLGKHQILFLAIDKSECYSTKLVNFFVYDNPRIIPLKPDSKFIMMDEGQSLLFMIDVADKDEDVKDSVWSVNNKEKKSFFKDSFVFNTDYNSTGRYNVSVTVIDYTKLNDSYTWEVVVRKKNKAPYSYSPLPDFATPKGENLVINLDDYFMDPDNDSMTYSISVTDKNSINVDIDTRLIGNKLEIDSNNFTGIIEVVLTAKDNYNGVITSNKFKAHIVKNKGKFLNNFNDNPYCGDEICSLIENCNNCQTDCGPCVSGMDKCVNNWICGSYSQCLPNGYMVKECFDENNCIDKSGMPDQIIKCDIKNKCYNKIKDDNERMIDCGGPCGPCPTCVDKIQNQGELGIDCGGPCNAVCPTCNDYIQNQFESDLDCGGPCNECVEGLKCYSWKDCLSHICKEGVCLSPTCSDNVKNQDEKGVDCGGLCNTSCPTCVDGLLNQGELRVDCGGPCNPCPSCSDLILNQNEEYADCGGVCRKCDWYDFEKNNLSKIYWSKILLLLILLPMIFLGLYKYFKKTIIDGKIEMLILLNKILGRKNSLKNNKEIIENMNIELIKIETSIMDANKIQAREKVIDLLTKFLDKISGINLSNDNEEIMRIIDEQEFRFPINKIIFYIANETKKISSNKYLSIFEVMDKVKNINLAVSELLEET